MKMDLGEDDIVTSIKDGSTFEDQIAILLKKFPIPTSTKQKIHKAIHDDLMSALSHAFPQIKIYFFGSLTTDLMVFGSNVDIYIANILTNTEDDLVTLESVKKIIEQNENFVDVQIHSSETSTIKCKHKTEITCDISLQDNLSVIESELLSCYVKQDEKIRTLIIILKFLLKFNRVTETTGFSYYMVYLMAIFYLQQEPYKLSPASEFLNYSEGGEGWDCSIVSPSFASKALENVLILDLVKGFFEFYNTFDYFSNVIAPYYGIPLKKVDFLKPFSLPECYQQYKEKNEEINITGGICIQDPVVLSRNVTAGLSLQVSADVIYLFQCIAVTLQTQKHALLYHLISLEEDLKERREFTLLNHSQLNEKDWFELVKKCSNEVLVKIFGCVVKKLTKSSTNIILHGSGDYNIFDGREQILKSLLSFLPYNVTNIDKEMLITLHIRKKSGGTLSKRDKPKWNFSIELTFNENPASVNFILSGSCSVINSKHLDLFFQIKLMKFMEVEEKNFKMDEKNKENQKCSIRSPRVNLRDSSIANFKKTRDNLMRSMEKLVDFDKQLNVIDSKFYVPRKVAEAQSKLILNDVQLALSYIFPQSEITIYGSAVSDLFTRNSTINLYVAVALQHFLLNELLIMALSNSEKFRHIIDCGSELRFIHCKTGKVCLLNRIDASAIKSNELIGYYVSLDEKIRKMMIVIKFWASIYKLTQSRTLNGYVITLMGIFYLQQKYNLPSMIEVQRPVLNDGIVTFSYAKVETSLLEHVTMKDLILGFFEFYGSFDFFTYVISIHIHLPLKKIRFVPPFDLPSEYKEYCNGKIVLKSNFGLCIQDPFNYNRNAAKNVLLQDIGLFSSLCRPAAFWMTCENVNTGPLFTLMSKCTSGNLEEFTVYKKEEHKDQKWKESIKDFALKILPGLLGCEIKTVSDITEDKVHYTCQGYCDVWSNRTVLWKTLTKSIQTPLDDINIDIAVSSNFKENTKDSDVQSIDISATFKDNPLCVVFTVKGRGRFIGKKCGISIVQHFIYTRLHIYLEGKMNKLDLNTCLDVPLEENCIEEDVARNADGSSVKTTVLSESDEDEKITYAEPVDVDFSEIYMDISDTSSNNTDQIQFDGIASPTSEKPLEGEETNVDDVPSDFFDDFTKEDFLNGLEIVDTCKKKSKSNACTSKKTKTTRRSSSKERQKDRSTSRCKRKKSPDGDKTRKKRLRSRSRLRNSRSRSPCRSRKRRCRRHRSVSRSSTPRRRGRSPETKKRKSFLEEIRDKLNEVSSQTRPASTNLDIAPSMYMHPMPNHNMVPVPPPLMSIPIPVPVLPPGVDSSDIYDQSFFIGTQPVTNIGNTSVKNNKEHEIISAKSFTGQRSDTSSTQSEDVITKLFTEKKISLSDYLTITAKSGITSSDSRLGKDMEVVAVCEEVMKTINHKTWGPLTVSPTSERCTSLGIKHQSPLLKNQVKFKFTSYVKDVGNDPFSDYLHNILETAGVLDGERDVYKLSDSVAEAISSGAEIDKNIAKKILKISLLGSSKFSAKCQRKEKKDAEMQCHTYTSVAVQTDGKQSCEGLKKKSKF